MLKILKNKSFLFFFLGNILSLIGFGFNLIAVSWLVLEETNSEFALGKIMAIATMPGLLLALFTGIIIDRVNKQVIQSSLDIVEKEFKMKLSFEQLESALTGNLLYDISTSDIISREGNYFKIVQQQESIQSQNLVNIKNSKIEKLILFDEITNYLLTVDYENFKPLGKILFPGRHLFTSVSYSDDSGVPVITNINFNFKEVERTNRPLKFPFNIPSKYVLKKI